MKTIYTDRIAAIRELMASKGWDAVLITGSDPHSSEYPAPRWQAVRWASGFTGEAGDVVITRDHAGLWTDSRYFIQAEEQLAGTGIVLHRLGQADTVDIPQYLAANASIVAVDGKCMSVAAVQEIEDAMSSAKGDALWKVVDEPDMFYDLWVERPRIPQTPIITLDETVVGESRMHKLVWLRQFLVQNAYEGMMLSALDEIAWLLNVRAEDIEYNPFVISYLYVSLDRICWFVKKDSSEEPDPDTRDSFEEIKADGVEICAYDDVAVILGELLAESEEDGRVFLDSGTLNDHLYKYITGIYGSENVVCGTSPVPLRKAVKNAMELDGLREAYFEDGVAMEKFLYWLENEVADGQSVSEWEASEKLTSFRAEIEGYRGNSFENISAYGANAALPHYSTPREGSALIEPCGLYLVDSGGQYLFGTTDITRTVPMGECTDLEKEDYTLVLKGMIRLSMAVFPRGTAGCQLDVLARNALWNSKRNFGHGTGHGIGFYLGVHEGPQSIRQNFNAQPILPGMVTSNEPSMYRRGRHGIRHENVILCREAGCNEFGDWLEFETLTLCHIDTDTVLTRLLAPEELDWLNAYNASVYEKLSPRLTSAEAAWLRDKCAAV